MKAKIVSQIKSAEKVMSAGRIKTGVIDDMGSISKIAASIYYQAASLEYLVNSARAQKAVKTKIYSQISKDFGNYVDMQARSYTSRLHHVYEWKRVGNPASRLWKLNMVPGAGYDMQINYSFKQSRTNVPNTRSLKKYVFKEKARIMEFRIPVTIRPRSAAGRLVFENQDGKTIVLPKGRSVRVTKPGGANAFQGFARTYERFAGSGMLNESIEASGVKESFTRAAKNASNVPSLISSRIVVNKISPNTVRALAASAAQLEAGKI